MNPLNALKFVVPIMLIVAPVSWIMLNKYHTEVPEVSRVLITVGAVVVSGVISYFLFPRNEGEED